MNIKFLSLAVVLLLAIDSSLATTKSSKKIQKLAEDATKDLKIPLGEERDVAITAILKGFHGVADGTATSDDHIDNIKDIVGAYGGAVSDEHVAAAKRTATAIKNGDHAEAAHAIVGIVSKDLANSGRRARKAIQDGDIDAGLEHATKAAEALADTGLVSDETAEAVTQLVQSGKNLRKFVRTGEATATMKDMAKAVDEHIGGPKGSTKVAAHAIRAALQGGDVLHAARAAGSGKVAQSMKDTATGYVNGVPYVGNRLAAAMASVSFSPTFTDSELKTLHEMVKDFALAEGLTLTLLKA